MSAFILVFAHRYFAVTDDEGRYRIDNVPPGTYTVVAWNEAMRPSRARVTVPDGGDVELKFVLAEAMMRLSSLTNRLFVAMALLAVLSIGAATYYATAAVTAQAEGELRRGLDEAGTLVEEYREPLLGHFSREARLVADLPQAQGRRRRRTIRRPCSRSPRTTRSSSAPTASWSPARDGRELARDRHVRHRGGILQVVSVPIAIGQAGTAGPRHADASASRSTARSAARFKALTNSEIAFVPAAGHPRRDAAAGGCGRHWRRCSPATASHQRSASATRTTSPPPARCCSTGRRCRGKRARPPRRRSSCARAPSACSSCAACTGPAADGGRRGAGRDAGELRASPGR